MEMAFSILPLCQSRQYFNYAGANRVGGVDPEAASNVVGGFGGAAVDSLLSAAEAATAQAEAQGTSSLGGQHVPIMQNGGGQAPSSPAANAQVHAAATEGPSGLVASHSGETPHSPLSAASASTAGNLADAPILHGAEHSSGIDATGKHALLL